MAQNSGLPLGEDAATKSTGVFQTNDSTFSPVVHDAGDQGHQSDQEKTREYNCRHHLIQSQSHIFIDLRTPPEDQAIFRLPLL